MDKTTWWTYRIINGKACWYRGKRTVDKKALYWEPQGGHSSDATSAPSTKPELPVDDPTFNKAWNDLLSDMALPFWRWRYPLSTERLEQWRALNERR
jgi:hypothetical protein